MPPKQRVTPGLGISPTPVRPSARPTDSFVQFTGNAESGSLRELASSLSRFGEQTNRFAAQRQKKQQEEQTEAGRIAFLKELEEQGTTAKAIAALEMRPQQSRFFRAAVQAAAGKVDALRARDFFYASKADELEDADTLEEFDALAQEALDEFRDAGDSEERTEAFENGFFPGYIAVMENARFEFARSIDGKLSEQRLNDFDIDNYDYDKEDNERDRDRQQYGDMRDAGYLFSRKNLGGMDTINDPMEAKWAFFELDSALTAVEQEIKDQKRMAEEKKTKKRSAKPKRKIAKRETAKRKT